MYTHVSHCCERRPTEQKGSGGAGGSGSAEPGSPRLSGSTTTISAAWPRYEPICVDESCVTSATPCRAARRGVYTRSAVAGLRELHAQKSKLQSAKRAPVVRNSGSAASASWPTAISCTRTRDRACPPHSFAASGNTYYRIERKRLARSSTIRVMAIPIERLLRGRTMIFLLSPSPMLSASSPK